MNNQLIMRSLPMVASVLGRKYGVKVEIEGNQAYTDGNTIHLPSLPFDSGDDMLNLVRAYLDHESAHIRHSDFDVIKAANISPLTMSIFNIIEDWRVENALVKQYPGCRANFNWLIKHHFDHEPPIRKDSITLLVDYILLVVRSWDLDSIAKHRDQVGSHIKSIMPGLYQKLNAILDNARISCDSSASCIDYAFLIVELFEAESKNLSESSKEQKEGNKEHSTRDENSAEGQNNIEQEGSAEQSNNEAMSESSAGSQAGDIDDKMKSSDSNTSSLTESQKKEVLKKLLKAKADDLPRDMGKAIGEMLERSTSGSNANTVVGIETEKPHRALSHADLQTVRRSSVALRAKLQGLLQTTTLQRSTPGRRGRLDTRKLYKAGNDPRVFLRNGEKHGIDTAVHILLDCSGSMRNRMTLASQACFAVCDSLTRINGVSVGVTAFPAATSPQDKRGSTNRTVGTILKHGQRLHSEFAMNASGNTPMGEALWFVMQQMYTLRENRKLILIITDGEPSSKANAAHAIKEGQAMGYEILGIGIMDKHITELLPETSKVISDIHELAPAMFMLLQNALLQTA